MSLARKAFPYTMTEDQTRILNVIFATHRRRICSLIEAANGAGKTTCIAVAAATLATKGERPTIACSTHSQTSRVIEELRRLQQKYKAVVLGSRDALCSSDGLKSAKAICALPKLRFRCPYFPPAADFHPWTMNISEMVSVAAEKEICAYETCWNSASQSDIVIVPQAYLLSEYSWKKASRIIDSSMLMIDECHNVLTRSFEVFDVGIEFISEAGREVSKLLRSRKKWTKKKLISTVGSIAAIYDAVTAEAEVAADCSKHALGYRLSREYIALKALFEGNYTTLIVGNNSARGLRDDASDSFGERLSYFDSTVMMSATPGAVKLYTSLLRERPLYVERIPSPYRDGQLRVYIVTDFTTKFTERKPSDGARLASLVDIALRGRSDARLGIFFPSYAYMHETANCFTKIGYTLIPSNREELTPVVTLSDSEGHLVMLAVQGGKAGEGYEYPGGLDIVLVVGLALPVPYPTGLEAMLASSLAFEVSSVYAYHISQAVQKAVQAVGRVIRGPRDKGIGVLMDRRFLNRTVLDSMPTWFRDCLKGSGSFGSLAQLIMER